MADAAGATASAGVAATVAGDAAEATTRLLNRVAEVLENVKDDKFKVADLQACVEQLVERMPPGEGTIATVKYVRSKVRDLRLLLDEMEAELRGAADVAAEDAKESRAALARKLEDMVGVLKRSSEAGLTAERKARSDAIAKEVKARETWALGANTTFDELRASSGASGSAIATLKADISAAYEAALLANGVVEDALKELASSMARELEGLKGRAVTTADDVSHAVEAAWKVNKLSVDEAIKGAMEAAKAVREEEEGASTLKLDKRFNSAHDDTTKLYSNHVADVMLVGQLFRAHVNEDLDLFKASLDKLSAAHSMGGGVEAKLDALKYSFYTHVEDAITAQRKESLRLNNTLRASTDHLFGQAECASAAARSTAQAAVREAASARTAAANLASELERFMRETRADIVRVRADVATADHTAVHASTIAASDSRILGRALRSATENSNKISELEEASNSVQRTAQSALAMARSASNLTGAVSGLISTNHTIAMGAANAAATAAAAARDDVASLSGRLRNAEAGVSLSASSALAASAAAAKQADSAAGHAVAAEVHSSSAEASATQAAASSSTALAGAKRAREEGEEAVAAAAKAASEAKASASEAAAAAASIAAAAAAAPQRKVFRPLLPLPPMFDFVRLPEWSGPG